MSDLGYLAAAYLLTAAAFGAYLLSLARRHRSAERRLGQAGGGPQGQAPQGPPGEGGEGSGVSRG